LPSLLLLLLLLLLLPPLLVGCDGPTEDSCSLCRFEATLWRSNHCFKLAEELRAQVRGRNV
jgi:hypothetical protein